MIKPSMRPRSSDRGNSAMVSPRMLMGTTLQGGRDHLIAEMPSWVCSNLKRPSTLQGGRDHLIAEIATSFFDISKLPSSFNEAAIIGSRKYAAQYPHAITPDHLQGGRDHLIAEILE